MNCARTNFQTTLAALLAALVAFSPAFAEPDDAEVAIDGASPPANAAQPAADAALALDASALSAAFNASGVSSYKCRTALKDFEKAVADANAAAVAQRAKVAEVARKYLTDSLEKARTAGDLDKVLVFQKALETVDGEIAGDAEEIVKLRNGRAAQLDKIDKGLVASGLTAGNAFHAVLEWQKKETTQKGEIEAAQKIAVFQQIVGNWMKETQSKISATQRITAHFSRPLSNPPAPPPQNAFPKPQATKPLSPNTTVATTHVSEEEVISRIVSKGVVEGRTPVFVTEGDKKGRAVLSFPENRGKAILKNGETSFQTMWSPCGGNAVYACRDYCKLLGFNDECHSIPSSVKSFEKGWDFSTRVHTISSGHVFVLVNKSNRFCAIKVQSVKDKSRGARKDEIVIEFKIF